MSDEPQIPTTIFDSRVLHVVLSVYGPYAFGLISLLLIWYFVAGPQLESQAINHEKNQELVTRLLETSSTLERASHTLERTSMALEQIVANSK